MNSLLDFVESKNGVIDVDASVANYKKQLESYVLSSRVDDPSIMNEINSFFDDHKGTTVGKMALVDFISVKLCKSNPDNIGKMKKKVSAFIDQNAGEEESKIFLVKRGPKGGVSRKIDSNSKEVKENDFL